MKNPSIVTDLRARTSREFISLNNRCGKGSYVKLKGGGSLTGQDIKRLIKKGLAIPKAECIVILAEREAVRQAKIAEAAEAEAAKKLAALALGAPIATV